MVSSNHSAQLHSMWLGCGVLSFSSCSWITQCFVSLLLSPCWVPTVTLSPPGVLSSHLQYSCVFKLRLRKKIFLNE